MQNFLAAGQLLAVHPGQATFWVSPGTQPRMRKHESTPGARPGTSSQHGRRSPFQGAEAEAQRWQALCLEIHSQAVAATGSDLAAWFLHLPQSEKARP